jgi:hypothetical protein
LEMAPGGIYNNDGTQSVTNCRNTIIAGNTGSGSPDVSGSLTSQGHNLIGDGSGGSGYVDTDLVGTRSDPIDPQLEPLGDYGGPTQTMRPLPTSPAVDAGDNTDAPDTDQRGFDRIVGILDPNNPIIDIGSVELQPDEVDGFAPRPDRLARAAPATWGLTAGSVVSGPALAFFQKLAPLLDAEPSMAPVRDNTPSTPVLHRGTVDTVFACRSCSEPAARLGECDLDGLMPSLR